MARKTTKTYYFSVEGKTEKLYLEWLAKTINKNNDANCQVKFHCKVQKNPESYVKQISSIRKFTVTHVCDIESQVLDHVQAFTNTLSRMKAAEKMGKEVKYELGYSNFTFELWMILHKDDCNRCYNHRDQYLAPLNRAFNQNFESLNHYKQEESFKRILDQLTLDDVKKAISRAKIITNRNRTNNTLNRQHGFEYFEDNPSLSIWISIEIILRDCGLI